MICQSELIERVRRYNSEVNEALLNKAYLYAMHRHSDQKRASGDPYFSHPLEVASILADMHMDDATIAVALLHDTIEDTAATREEIDEIFGKDLGKLVEGLTKLTKLELVPTKMQQAENFRKLLLAVTEDIRILLIKLADRLHNMRTLDHIKQEKRLLIAEETMEIYAPLAGRMGMQTMREELEDLSFRVINPTMYKKINDRLDELINQNKNTTYDIETTLSTILKKHNIKAHVKGRVKKPWSIFRKIQDKVLSFEQLSDIFGFRIIVETIEDCYRALGCVHTLWSMVPGRFKDYISTPKKNDYRSLHTTIIGPSRQRVELQIKTSEMNKVADYGIASHAFYKEYFHHSQKKKKFQEETLKDCRAYTWLHQTIKNLLDGENSEDFLENTKLELYQDKVFCFTPKGMLIALPKDATPIDFAYAVHTDIGNTCIGCKVNGRMMPLMLKLQNGDEIEIICANNKTPQPIWEKIVVTGKAKFAIRRAIKHTTKNQYLKLGKKILEDSFYKADKSMNLDEIKGLVHLLGKKDLEDVFIAIGKGELSTSHVLNTLFPEKQKKESFRDLFAKHEEGWLNIRNAAGMIFKKPRRKIQARTINDSRVMLIGGIDSDLPVKFSSDGALPGDEIVGIFEPGSGITIYPIHSPFLRNVDQKTDSWINVQWDFDKMTQEKFLTRIAIIVSNSPGSLAGITRVIAEHDANIHSLSTKETASDFSEIIINVEVCHLKDLDSLLLELKSISYVSQAKRIYGEDR